jgi:hypothetical protein
MKKAGFDIVDGDHDHRNALRCLLRKLWQMNY